MKFYWNFGYWMKIEPWKEIYNNIDRTQKRVITLQLCVYISRSDEVLESGDISELQNWGRWDYPALRGIYFYYRRIDENAASFLHFPEKQCFFPLIFFNKLRKILPLFYINMEMYFFFSISLLYRKFDLTLLHLPKSKNCHVENHYYYLLLSE